MNFTAIDFETANYYGDSACAVGLVKVNDGKIVETKSFLIRPPSKWFYFTYVHNITWDDVKNKPTFDEVWPEIQKFFVGIDFLVAHNASFDKGVLEACCRKYSIEIPNKKFKCTVQLARKTWEIFPTKLPNVCEYLGIELDHHEPLSDALACARIAIRAMEREAKSKAVV
jgi:DNA polymerase-3 subunit epsilon